MFPIRAKRLLNCIIDNRITPVEFNALLVAEGRDVDWAAIVNHRGQMDLMAESSTAMNAVGKFYGNECCCC